MHNKIKAVFFDQDNTIFNSSEAAKISYQTTFKFIETETDNVGAEFYVQWRELVSTIMKSENPKERTFRYSLGLFLRDKKLPIELLEAGMRTYLDELEDNIAVKLGVPEYFSDKPAIKHILFTEDSREQSTIKLEKHNLTKEFDMVITADDTGVMKPHPSYFETAWKKIGLNADDCIYVGDNWEKDCKYGQENGGIGVSAFSNDNRADFCINRIDELLTIINENN
jgi:putative hydrolase of the HAD superfamily